VVWRFLGEVTTPCPGIAVPKNAMYPFKPCRPSLPRTSVGLRRIVGTCQDPWSLASFPLWSLLDARYQAESDICGFSSRRQSLLLLCTPAVVFLHTRIFNGTLVTCVFSRKCQCGQICSRWRSYNIDYIKLSVYNMIHLLLSSGTFGPARISRQVQKKYGTLSRSGIIVAFMTTVDLYIAI
jgi:hypothetical protein